MNESNISRREAGILARDDGAAIAYHALPGRNPGIVFLHGLMSDMEGGKALALEAFCQARGQAFLRFDTYGHGQSSGRFQDGTIGRWADDAVCALDRLTQGPQVLVGSSMGGWVALLAALRRPDRVAGLVGIAAAPDFTEDLIWREFTPAQRQSLLTEGQVSLPSQYGEQPYVISRALIDEGRNHLLLADSVNLSCPARLIHGMRDADVPWRTSERLADQLAAEDVVLTLVKDGDHRLSRPQDLDRMVAVVAGLLDQLEA